jgi:F0F1-type ATP synthase assembly protein I
MRVLLKDIRLYLNQFRLTGDIVVGLFVGERVGYLVGALVGA